MNYKHFPQLVACLFIFNFDLVHFIHMSCIVSAFCVQPEKLDLENSKIFSKVFFYKFYSFGVYI